MRWVVSTRHMMGQFYFYEEVKNDCKYYFTCKQFYMCLLLLSQLQSQFLCVKVLFLVPCVQKTRTVSPYGTDCCVYTVTVCSYRGCVRSVGNTENALSNWYGGTAHGRHQAFADCGRLWGAIWGAAFVKGAFELKEVDFDVRKDFPTSHWNWKFTKYH